MNPSAVLHILTNYRVSEPFGFRDDRALTFSTFEHYLFHFLKQKQQHCHTLINSSHITITFLGHVNSEKGDS